ncbi:protein translocase subunit SecF [Thioalbus denitrificans]|uniref:Protein-export membrane protein SecF n=1 Tax=Thioalbus denitrificans TaxID=547122 RepID=A0A369CDP5_9GAMM|nr:protein translocase subunit SecF [Thioalbus denitrificans]RCX31823.1 protein translocase subunit secF [Thioalbus denitrificans]
MEFFRINRTIDFMRLRKPMVILSVVLVLASILLLATRGLNFGLDFTGGTLIEVGYENPVDLAGVRETLRQGEFGDAVAQHFGTSRDVLVRLAPRADVSSADLSTRVLRVLQDGAAGQKVEVRRVEFVGPQVGDQLVEQGGLAMLYALIGIFIYVAFRFEWRFSAGAILATVHDVVLTLGLFSLLQVEFDLTVLAAVLAVIGYSVNDTVVVFDRIRENFRKLRKGTSMDVVNSSLTQTLSRTIMTSGTTLIVVVALFLLGGTLIHAFAIALIFGIVIGTYSSIYVASFAALALGVSRQDLVLPKKEGAEAGGQP